MAQSEAWLYVSVTLAGNICVCGGLLWSHQRGERGIRKLYRIVTLERLHISLNKFSTGNPFTVITYMEIVWFPYSKILVPGVLSWHTWLSLTNFRVQEDRLYSSLTMYPLEFFLKVNVLALPPAIVTELRLHYMLKEQYKQGNNEFLLAAREQ